MKNIFLILLLLVVIACEKTEVEIVASVNEENLTLDEFKAFFPEDKWQEISYETKREYINEWIKLTLLAQESDNSQLSEQPAVQVRINSAVKNVKANVVLAQRISEIEITEDDIFNYYKLHKSVYQDTRKEYKIQRIFIKEKSRLDEVLGYLRSGEPYTDVVKEYSEESLGASGGYTGFLGENDLDSSIWKKLLTLKKWNYSSASTTKGYYIFRYYDTQEVVYNKDFTEVESEIREIVFQQKKKEIYESVIEELKRKADISISL